MKGWEAEWSNQQNIVFEIIDVEVFLSIKKYKYKYHKIVHCYSVHHDINFLLCNALGKSNQ